MTNDKWAMRQGENLGASRTIFPQAFSAPDLSRAEIFALPVECRPLKSVICHLSFRQPALVGQQTECGPLSSRLSGLIPGGRLLFPSATRML
jgi:hypothetical protein